MHTRPVPGAPTSGSVGERPSAPSTPRRVGTVDHRTVVAAVVAWKETGEMSGMLNVARQVIGLPLTQPGSVRAGSAHREGRGTRAPSQERCSNQEDPRPMEMQPKAAGARQRPPVIENRLPMPDSNDSDDGPTLYDMRRLLPAPTVLPRGETMRPPKRSRSPSPTNRVIPIGAMPIGAIPVGAGPRAPAGPPPDHLIGNRGGRECHGRERPLETWQTFEHTPESWHRVLNDIGIDINARRELFCLSQMGDDELWRAQDIISNLLKKESNNDRPHNPSGFVHACVLNVQNDLGWGSTPWEPRDKRRRC